jgi:heterodisulfide reductase subunit C
MIAQIIFTLMLIVSFGMFAKQVGRLRRNIMLGRPEKITGNTAQRFKNMVLVAFGQQKMFKRLLPAFLHLSIYVAFIITQIELIEVFIDGFTGQHRLIWHTVEGTALAGLYTFTISFIEILSVLALIATFIFLARRNLLKIPRFHKPEMNGWPKLDGNLILYFEIYLVTCIFMMNSGDQALQALDVYHHTDAFTVSSLFVPMLSGLSEGTIWAIERIGWWGHLIGVLIFLNYIPYSKHLHIFLAFPNTFFARLTPKGELTNMEAVKKEVAPMFEIEEEVIAAPVMKVAESKDAFANPSETVDDIFGDPNEEEGISDIFGDAGSEQEEGISDIFGDAGSEQEEGISDVFGNAGSEQEEGISDVFGNAGSEQEESVDDIFGGNSTEESVDDIFGGNSAEENVDDIFGGNDNDVSTDDIFDAPVAQPTKKAVTPVAVEPEEEIIKFGASDVFDLSWKSLMDSYTCTECGRCTSVCPANLTGKKLSPRKVMMDVRDRADEIGKNLDAKTHTVKDYDDGKNLFDYITTEELHACTTCNACVEACPVLINPLDIIVELRRNLILDQAKSPESWNVMFTNIENNGAPWQFSASDRANWIEEI